MSSLSNFLTGFELIEEVNSPINGKLSVVKDREWGTYIKGGGLTQSGGIAKKVWNASISHVYKTKEPKNILILGFGGGSISLLCKKYWPNSKITGVDLDNVIVELGLKYLGVNAIKGDLEVKITGAKEFLEKNKTKYDLICVDTYIGDSYPIEFEETSFLKLVKKSLAKDGIAIYNRLYYGPKKKIADAFEKNLKEVFENVECLYPELAAMFIAKS